MRSDRKHIRYTSWGSELDLFTVHVHHNMDADFSRHGDVSYALGISRDLSPVDAAQEAVYVLIDLSKRLNIPRFSDIDKVDRNDFHSIAENAVQSSSNEHNVKEMTVDDYVSVLENAYADMLSS